MAEGLLTTGWLLNLLASLWVGLILLDLLLAWVFKEDRRNGWLGNALAWLAGLPVNGLRRIMPTVYRGTDFAPWITILVLVLFATFLFRAMVYWGMLHQPPLG
ncbi:MAG: YggT family protein [candidate division FCPU426 bacterium]